MIWALALLLSSHLSDPRAGYYTRERQGIQKELVGQTDSDQPIKR